MGSVSAIAAKKKKGPQLPACQSATRTGAFGRCPIRYPSGSPRKSATIIPFPHQRASYGLAPQLVNGHLEKLLSLPIADHPAVNVNESERERSGIICRQFCDGRSVAAIFRGALMTP